MSKKQWEKISAPNGPSARSGHRMVLVKKQLFVFGGFHDNLRDCKYFNDVYCFDLESYKWRKIEPVGTPPAPRCVDFFWIQTLPHFDTTFRSGCCMIPLQDGKILIYGGYSKEQVKKDVEKGHVYTDAFVLGPDSMSVVLYRVDCDLWVFIVVHLYYLYVLYWSLNFSEHDPTQTKFKWQQVKLSNQHFSARCSMPVVTSINGSSAYCFGGVFDVEEGQDCLNFFLIGFCQAKFLKMRKTCAETFSMTFCNWTWSGWLGGKWT